MKVRPWSLTAIVVLLLGLPLIFGSAAASAEGRGLVTYRVTLDNLTNGQPFSPPVAATHQKAIRMFEVGRLASDELAAIAQDGNEVPMANLFTASDKVDEVVDVGRPLTSHGKIVGAFTDSATT